MGVGEREEGGRRQEAQGNRVVGNCHSIMDTDTCTYGLSAGHYGVLCISIHRQHSYCNRPAATATVCDGGKKRTSYGRGTWAVHGRATG